MTYKIGTKAYLSQYHARNKAKIADKTRRWYYLHKHGMTLEQVVSVIVEQGGVCPICECDLVFPSRQTHVDHCHKTHRTRGVLCNKCNLLLGYAAEHPGILRRAAGYLARTK